MSINKRFLDKDTSPGVDFYQFVNGGWMRETEIPADRSSWGSFHELSKNTDHLVLDILEEALDTPGPAENKAAMLYESGMDISCIQKDKLSALEALIKTIDVIEDIQHLPQLTGQLISKGIGSLMNVSVHPDLGDTHHYAVYLEPPNLGLPEREYYLDQDDKTIAIRKKYQKYVAQLLESEASFTPIHAENAARDILKLEQDLATKMLHKEDRRQVDKIYNPFTMEVWTNEMSEWDWESFFHAMHVTPPLGLIVTDPEYFYGIRTYLKTISLDTVKQYFKFLLIHHAAPFAHAALEEAHFDFYSRTIQGIETMRPRQERLVKVINESLGELLGQLFVSKHFPASGKATAVEMVTDIVDAFHNRINQLIWMSPSTKQFAKEKLSAFKVKIGYPDCWKDFSSLNILPAEAGGNYLRNIMAVTEWKFQHDADRIRKEVDREEWFMAPQVVNAYYNPMFNEIVFPAAILQPPFFDWEAEAAANYGGIGAVIGHEITHGFDDQGSRFDKEGNLHEWWTEEDRARFTSLTKQLVDQFDAYFPFEDLSLNGAFTLGENIADLGGLSVAYDALQLYYKRHGKPGTIDGFSADQRFFISWATVWRTKTRPEALRNQIKTDPHPPGMYRAVAAPSNMDSFYHAFDIEPGGKWYRQKDERIKIW